MFLGGCKNINSPVDNKSAAYELNGKTKYAEKFSIQTVGDYDILSVYSPWQNAASSSFQYLLGSDGENIPDSLKDLTFIKTPLNNVVIMSTTFIPFIDTLGQLSSISAVSGGEFIYNKELGKKINKGLVRDIGYDQNLNYEVLVDLSPDVVFMYGVQTGIIQTVNKLKDFGIPVVLCADYLEPHPLGRAEWLKFFSLFYSELELANDIYIGIEKNYNSIAKSSLTHEERPSVMLGLPWKDSWYIAGGSSYAAKLIHDAGGEYIYKDLENSEALPIDIEAVFYRCLDADIWINPGVATSLDMILEHDQRFESLNAFQQKSIYSNAKRTGIKGGNDYWESGIIHPDQILHDLSMIFRDSVQEESELQYYFRLD
jgi:iron complex transport system substrate-binding protein